MGPAHIGVGLAAKRIAPEVPAPVLVAASEWLDILYFMLWPAKVERSGVKGERAVAPWSHGLLMSALWSAAAGAAASRYYRNRRIGGIIGGLVFSHWLLDFLAHDRDLPLAFKGSPQVGLGFEVEQRPEGIKIHWLRSNLAEMAIAGAGAAIYRAATKKHAHDKIPLDGKQSLPSAPLA